MTMRSVFDLVRRDHRRHLRLIENARDASSPIARARAIAALVTDLRHHLGSEETALLSRLLVNGEVRPLARRAIAEHQRLQRLVSDVTGHVHDEDGLETALRVYRLAFLAYARFEEDELYPAAASVLGAERCARLVEHYLAVRPDSMNLRAS
jgi:hypothetical protein